MDVWFIKFGVYLLTACLIWFDIGYGLTLPGFNRRKWLKGESVHLQMYNRTQLGQKLMSQAATAAFIIAFMHAFIGFAVPHHYVYSIPETVEIWHSMDQGKAILMLDGVLVEMDHSEVPYYITKDCQCIYYSQGVGAYRSSAFLTRTFHVYLPAELDDSIMAGDEEEEDED